MTDLGAEVVNYVSHATQQRLQSLLEKVSQVAQQRNVNFKVCLLHHYSETHTGIHFPLHGLDLAQTRLLQTSNTAAVKCLLFPQCCF